MRRPAGDAGSASLWVLTGGLLVLVLALVIAARTQAVLARHRAVAAADLAAVAAAEGIGRDATSAAMCARAAATAQANGARLTGCTVRLDASARSGTVAVRVALVASVAFLGAQQVMAAARAERAADGAGDGAAVAR